MESLSSILRERHEPLLHVSIDQSPEGEAGKHAPVVVLIHGIASSATTFENLIPLLAGTHRIVALDLLGFGLSPHPDHAQYTLEEHVDAVAHTLRSLHLHHFTLVGHSLGCLISARYAATHNHTVEKLVLVSPPIYLSPNELGNRVGRARMSGYLAAFHYFRENKTFTLTHAARVSRLLPIKHVMEITEDNWRAFTLSLQNCIESETAISDVSAVDAPIEVVYGRWDEFIVPESLRILERMRNVNTHRVESNDHIIRLSMARVVAQAIATE